MVVALLLLLVLSAAHVGLGTVPEAEWVERCVSGYCLPAGYEKLETPFTDSLNIVYIETDIMDVLQVRHRLRNASTTPTKCSGLSR